MITAFIPARQGSERLPNKNMRCIAGVSLASLSVLQALELPYIQEVVFSTDSELYATTVMDDLERLGYSEDRIRLHFREASEAGAKSKIFDVLRGLGGRSFFSGDFVVLMLPTAPLRRRETAQKVLELANNHRQTAFTGCPYDFHVAFAFKELDEGRNGSEWHPLLNESPMRTGITRSQDQVRYFHPHGGFASVDLQRLKNQKTIYDSATPVITSRTEGLDVDVLEDLDLVRCYESALSKHFPFLPT